MRAIHATFLLLFLATTQGQDDGQCEQPIDLVFALDASSSVKEDGYLQIKEFVKGVISHFDVSRTGTHVGTLLFSEYADVMFRLDEMFNKDEIYNRVDNFPYPGYRTATDDALRVANTEIFSYIGGARQGVPQVLILLNDGKCTVCNEDVKSAAQPLKDRGITIFTIGVTEEIDKDELLSISSEPAQDHYFYVDDFDKLSDLMINLQNKSCIVKKGKCPVPLPPFDCKTSRNQCYDDEECPNVEKCCFDGCIRKCRSPLLNCLTPIDVAFAFDSSSSVQLDTYKEMKSVAQQVVDSFATSQQNARFGALTYGTEANIDFDFVRYNNASAIKSAIRDLPYLKTHTRVDKALKLAKSDLFSLEGNVRSRRPMVLIVFFDGSVTRSMEDLAIVSKPLKDYGVKIISIGVGPEVNRYQMQKISDDNSIFSARTFSEIIPELYSVAEQTCTEKPGKCAVHTPVDPELCVGVQDECEDDFDCFGAAKCCKKGCKKTCVPKLGVCLRKVDIAFGMHMNMNREEFEMAKFFLKSAVDRFEISNSRAHAAVLTFGQAPEVVFDFNSGQSNSEAKRRIDGIEYKQGKGDVAGLLGEACDAIFCQLGGTRDQVPKILVLLTDETNPSDGGELTKRVKTLRARGVDVIVLGVGQSLDIDMLQSVTSNDQVVEDRVWLATETIDAMQYVQDVADFACSEAGQLPPIGTFKEKGSCGAKPKTCYKGPKGSRGRPGKVGERGEPGTTGPPGKQGIAGSKGVRGRDGVTGTKGVRGEEGMRGLPGFPGHNGIPGVQGVEGRTGSDGDCGLPGASGEAGPIGLAGFNGPPGRTGVTGTKGRKGEPAVFNPDLVIEPGEKGDAGDLGPRGYKGQPGSDGAPGAIGNNGVNGERGLSGEDGEMGDIGSYLSVKGLKGVRGDKGPPGFFEAGGINTTEGVVGPPGDKGAQGVKGERGPYGTHSEVKGRTGFKGVRGDTGEQGETGETGTNGQQGKRGEEGRVGDDGLPGDRGFNGAQGQKGEQGDKGEDGIRGEEGEQGKDGDSIEGPQGAPGEENVEAGRDGRRGDIGPAGPPGPRGAHGEQQMGEAGNRGSVGPRGPRGDNGIPGRPGMVGLMGPKGYKGYQGRKGDDGANAQLIKGKPGMMGPPGKQGVPGSVGNVGAKGFPGNETIIAKCVDGNKCPVGVQGERGPPGNTGEIGMPGADGVEGSQGFRGGPCPMCPSGDQGESGRPGDVGQEGVGGSKGDEGDQGSAGGKGLKGEPGSDGGDGRKGEPGVTGETGGPGKKGEPAPGIARAPQGEPGRDGAEGREGERGPRGEKGDVGFPGSAGFAGRRGADGKKGEIGLTGSAGLDGEKGTAGAEGEKGAPGDGPPGYRGEDGASGEVGEDGEPGPQGRKGEPGTRPSDEEIERLKQTMDGAKGSQGDSGIAGPRGPDGERGVHGDPGDRGDRGDAGRSGPGGERGEPGPKGKTGEDGNPGFDGFPGYPGKRGDSGENGRPGRAGVTEAGDRGEVGDKGPTGEPGIDASSPIGCFTFGDAADIGFILDSSSSVTIQDFNKQKEFVKNILGQFPVGPDETLAGIIKYGKQADIEIKFDEYFTAQDLFIALDDVQHTSESESRLDLALKRARDELYTDANGARGEGTSRALVILGDGYISGGGIRSRVLNANAQKYARDLRDAGVNIFAIGVGVETNRLLLETFVSDKSQYIAVESYQGLVGEIINLQNKFASACTTQGVPGRDGRRGAYGEVGPKGEKGLPGDNPRGETGPQGPKGVKGEEGIGIRGIPGDAGLIGLPGDHGKNGADGASMDGEPGRTGEKGFPGRSVDGSRGPKGIPGDQGLPGADTTQILCDNVLQTDLLFLLDTSASVGERNFAKMKDFIVNIVKTFDVDNQLSRVSVMTFDTETRLVIRLSDQNSQRRLVESITNIEYVEGRETRIDRALSAAQDAFSEANGGRSNANKALVLLADGQQTFTRDSVPLERAVKPLADGGVIRYAIGIGSEVSEEELGAVAGENVVYAENFDALLLKIEDQIAVISNSGCRGEAGTRGRDGEPGADGREGPRGPRGPSETGDDGPRGLKGNKGVQGEKQGPGAPGDTGSKGDRGPAGLPGCTGQIGDLDDVPTDLGFMLDASGSLYEQGFRKEKDFVKKVIEDLGPLSQTGLRVGVVVYSDEATLEIPFNFSYDVEEVKRAIDNIPFEGKGTRMDLGLKKSKEMFKRTNGGRGSSKKVLILLADGQQTYVPDAMDPIDVANSLARESDVDMFAIGIGQEIDKTELEAMLSKPEHIFLAKDIGSLIDDLTDDIKQALTCEGGPRGPTGRAGDDGPPGVVGIKGEEGLTGKRGDQGDTGYGPTGDKGPQGFEGPSGDKGEKGYRGVIGSTGDQGLRGEKGFVGNQGPRGDDGVMGLDGEKGARGFSGRKGRKGDTSGGVSPRGPDGEKGDKGEQGEQGDRGVVPPGSDINDYVGPRGPPGQRGNEGPPGPPGQLLVKPGDIGESGPPGEKGLMGAFGENGAQGEQGFPGQKGSRGVPGSTGPDGADGEPGKEGNWGEQGPPGDAGVGRQGEPGDHGDRGVQGRTGAPGPKGYEGFFGMPGTKGDRGPHGPPGYQQQRDSRKAVKGIHGEKGFAGGWGETGEPGEFIPGVGEKGEKGPPGDMGDVGPKGEPGPAGERGMFGVPGTQGFKGRVGSDGPPGAQGPAGPKGYIGETIGGSEKGDVGEAGLFGLTGRKGKRGEQGPTGVKGKIGFPGFKGLAGTPGFAGLQGDEGAPGPLGAIGPAGYPGVKGAPGPKGKLGPSGIAEGFYIVRHSQSAVRAKCPRDYKILWEGYSLMYTVGNGHAHAQDLGDAGSCQKSFSTLPFLFCSIAGTCKYATRNDFVYWLAGTSRQPMMPVQNDAIDPFISRCVVCEAPSTHIAVHSQDQYIPECPPGWGSLWDGYSFLMVGGAGSTGSGQSLSSSGSCLEEFRAKPFIECQGAQGTCHFFSDKFSFWLTTIKKNQQFTRQTQTTLSATKGDDLTSRVSRCKVCIRKNQDGSSGSGSEIGTGLLKRFGRSLSNIWNGN